jgi:hypothetical protein
MDPAFSRDLSGAFPAKIALFQELGFFLRQHGQSLL